MAFNSNIQELPEEKVLLPDLLDNVQWQSPCKKFRGNPPRFAQQICGDDIFNDQIALGNYLNRSNSLLTPMDKHTRNITPSRSTTFQKSNLPNPKCLSEDALLCNLPTTDIDCSNNPIYIHKNHRDPIDLRATASNRILLENDGRTSDVHRHHWRENVDIFEHCNVPEDHQSIRSLNQKGASTDDRTDPTDVQRDGYKTYPWPEGYFTMEAKDVQLLALSSMSKSTEEHVADPCTDRAAARPMPDVLGKGQVGIIVPVPTGNASEADDSICDTQDKIPTVVGARYLQSDIDHQRHEDCLFDSDLDSNMNQSGMKNRETSPSGKAFNRHTWNESIVRRGHDDHQQGGLLNSKPTLDCLASILKQHESMLIDWENLDYKIRQFQWAMTELYQSKEILHFKIETVSLLIHSTISSLKKFMTEQSIQTLPSSSSTTTTASSGVNTNCDLLVENSENERDSSRDNSCADAYLMDRYSCEENFTEEEESCHTSNPCCECKFNKSRNAPAIEDDAELVVAQVAFERITSYNSHKDDNLTYSEDIVDGNDDKDQENCNWADGDHEVLSEHISCIESFESSEDDN